MRMPTLIAATVLALASSPAGATVADDLCAPTDDPCVVSGVVAIDADSPVPR